jgi:hypothetical protein
MSSRARRNARREKSWSGVSGAGAGLALGLLAAVE